MVSSDTAGGVPAQRERRSVKEIRERLTPVLIVLAFCLGVGLMLYPTVSDLWNRQRNNRLANAYEQTISVMDDSEIRKEFAEAEGYNRQHTVNTIKGGFAGEKYILTHPYDQLLDPEGNGVMGVLEIPKIHVRLAIHHGIGEEALSKGCGHVEGTSLPVGGKGTHSVLAAHRGLPSAKLFTDLDQLKEGDVFTITVLDRKMAYEVDQIRTVKPTNIRYLALDPKKDLVTLLTCTPYAVNTDRLLVRGHRVPYTEKVQQEAEGKNAWAGNRLLILIIAAAGCAAVLTGAGIVLRKKRKMETEKAESGNTETVNSRKEGGAV